MFGILALGVGEYIPKYLLTNTILPCILRFLIILGGFCGLVVGGFLLFFDNFISEEWGNADTSMILQGTIEGPGYFKMFLFKNSAAPEVYWITSLNPWLGKIGSYT